MFDALGVLGGEQSGHIIFSKHATTGDGILTALAVFHIFKHAVAACPPCVVPAFGTNNA